LLKTPFFKDQGINGMLGVDMMLFPLSAFRASSKATEKVYESILKNGTQENVLDIMQTRDELYDRLDYLNFEKNLDEYIKNMEEK
jgi:PEP phosphonomutase and related enzymes